LNAAADKMSARKVCRGLMLYNLCIHLGFGIYDKYHPDVWLNWDRADQRLDAIKSALWAADDLGTFSSALLSQGIVGDYGFQLIFYALGGPTGVILFQIFLSTIAVAALFEIALVISDRIRFATCVTLLYLHFPHSLALPHFLASEAVFVPLIILSFLFLFRSVRNNGNSSNIIVAGILLGLASMVRPITIPLGIVAYLLYFALSREKPRTIWMAFVLVSLMPVSIWMGLQYVSTGHLTLGDSSHDMGHNLSNRVERISWTLTPDERAEVFDRYLRAADGNGHTVDREVLTLGEYLEFATDYPSAYLQHLGRDAMVYIGKSGATRLVFDYFELLPPDRVKKIQRTWRRGWERNGLFSAAGELSRSEPLLTISSIVLSIACVLFFVISMSVGAYKILRDAWETNMAYRLMTSMLVIFPFYVFGLSQVVNAMQSRHRAPAEFALSILFFYGIFALKSQREHVHDRQQKSIETHTV